MLPNLSPLAVGEHFKWTNNKSSVLDTEEHKERPPKFFTSFECTLCLMPLNGGISSEPQSDSLSKVKWPDYYTTDDARRDVELFTNCKHLVHTNCLIAWFGIQDKRSCVVCSAPLSKEDIDQVISARKDVYYKIRESNGFEDDGLVRVPYGNSTLLYEKYTDDNGDERQRLVAREYADGRKRTYSGDEGQERNVTLTTPEGVLTFEGPKGHERIVHEKRTNGEVWVYEGKRKEEFPREKVFPNGDIRRYWLYSRIPVLYSWYRAEDGSTWKYGRTGFKDSIGYADGSVAYYDAGKLTQRVDSDGAVTHFQGIKGHERPTYKELPNGTVERFQHIKFWDYVKERQYADGTVDHFDVVKSDAKQLILRKARRVLPNNQGVEWFQGAEGEERMVRAMRPGGVFETYEGSRGKEHLVSIERTKENVVEKYDGERGDERLVQIDRPDEDVVEYYKGPRGKEVRDYAKLPGNVLLL